MKTPIIMKQTLLTIALNSMTLLSIAQNAFTVSGKIKGEKANGQIVKLWGNNGQTALGSATIKNNTFEIKGKISEAELIRMTIAPAVDAAESTWRAANFYLDKGNITLSGAIDSLPTYYYKANLPNVKPRIEGSQAQSLADQLNRSIRTEQLEIGKLDKMYMEFYHLPALEGKFNTDKGIELLKDMAPYKKAIFQKKWNFIKNNPEARISIDEANYMLMGYGEESLSRSQMDELLHIFEGAWKGKKALADLKSMISKAKATAIGSKILDGPVLDKEGNKVQLTSVFPKDKKYILLEFWASWCGPCRGEIPHLRHTYTEWKNRGFDIVSISLDEKEADWKKAMNEESMIWHQYNAREGFDSKIARSYDIQGIPYALLIDSEGNIVRHGMRGASLDQALSELIQ